MKNKVVAWFILSGKFFTIDAFLAFVLFTLCVDTSDSWPSTPFAIWGGMATWITVFALTLSESLARLAWDKRSYNNDDRGAIVIIWLLFTLPFLLLIDADSHAFWRYSAYLCQGFVSLIVLFGFLPNEYEVEDEQKKRKKNKKAKKKNKDKKGKRAQQSEQALMEGIGSEAMEDSRTSNTMKLETTPSIPLPETAVEASPSDHDKRLKSRHRRPEEHAVFNEDSAAGLILRETWALCGEFYDSIRQLPETSEVRDYAQAMLKEVDDIFWELIDDVERLDAVRKILTQLYPTAVSMLGKYVSLLSRAEADAQRKQAVVDTFKHLKEVMEEHSDRMYEKEKQAVDMELKLLQDELKNY